MVKRVLIFIAVLCASCSRTVDIAMTDMVCEKRAFIECYCTPGGLYNLTAAYLSPIDEPQNLDYSDRFECYITDDKRRRLYQGLFQVGGYLYSHGSPDRLSPKYKGELKLELKSEFGDSFVATTTVVDPVKIVDVRLEGTDVKIRFCTSEDPQQNFYVASATQHRIPKAEVLAREFATATPEYGSGESELTIRFKEILDVAARIEVSLVRISEEGYRYQCVRLDNIEALSSKILVGAPLVGNIDGCYGVFACYTRDTFNIDL